MELRVLRYFLAVVREESITAAAQSLHVTQPTLSRQLMELEEEIGAKLFLRGGRSQRIVLTEKGMLLRRRAEELIDLADKTQVEMRDDDAAVCGEIAIGGGESDGMRLIAQAARRLQTKYPGIRYRLYSGNAEDVKDQLEKGLLDFGVFIEPADIEKYERLRLPAADTWGLLLRRDHPLAAGTCITPQDLLNTPLLASRQRLVSKSFAAWFGRDISRLNVVANYNLIYNASLMVEEGMGCALCLDKLVNTAGSRLCFLPLAPNMQVSLSMAWKKYQKSTRANALFLAEVQSLCREAETASAPASP